MLAGIRETLPSDYLGFGLRRRGLFGAQISQSKEQHSEAVQHQRTTSRNLSERNTKAVPGQQEGFDPPREVQQVTLLIFACLWLNCPESVALLVAF